VWPRGSCSAWFIMPVLQWLVWLGKKVAQVTSLWALNLHELPHAGNAEIFGTEVLCMSSKHQYWRQFGVQPIAGRCYEDENRAGKVTYCCSDISVLQT
jgi:hypothetical protein